MKMNLDCIRHILLTIENYNKPMQMLPNEFCRLVSSYDPAEIIYCCEKLHEGNYLKLSFFNLPQKLISEPEIQFIGDLTFQGHEFLANIKTDSNWNKTKYIFKTVGSSSLTVIKEIATKVITESIKQSF